MIPRLFDLTGKIAIVTGSSRGIGLAIAAALAEQGSARIPRSPRAGPAFARSASPTARTRSTTARSR